MAADPWKPDQYDRFRAERHRPFFDLLALVRPTPDMRAVDLGCGTGELTRHLHRRLGARETVGLDSSAAMLERSQAHVEDGLRFARGDIAEYADAAGVDLVFSNAALHWLPGQTALLARLTAALRPNGQLAVQVPANHDHPSHVVAAAVAGELGVPARESPVLPPEAYAALLERLAYREQHVRLQVYTHHLAARDAVIEWVKGTLLTDYERRMAPAQFQGFLVRYRERLLPLLDDTRPYFYAFKRILLWGRR